jgi:queuine tRNA-ribosyltransferase
MAVKFQNDLGADCLMCLDDLPKHGTKKSEVIESLRRTHLWAERCKKSHDGKGLLFGIIQGNVYNDLREKSAKFINSLDFDGISIGGLCIGEGKEKTLELTKICAENVSRDKPLYLMGVGSPEDIIKAIDLGVDIFDSKFPSEIARRESLFTKDGRIDISKRIFKEDFKPIQESCKCEVCEHFSRAYLHHLVKIKEPLGKRLATLHNLQFVNDLMERIKIAIKENEFQKFKKEFLKRYKC